MKTEGEEKPLTMDDLVRMYKELHTDYSRAVNAVQKQKTNKILWMVIALFFVYLYLSATKHSIVWVPDPNDSQMRVEYSDWWGIKKRTFYPVWRKPSGEENWDSEQWCIKWPGGTWDPFLKDDGENVYYEWPGKGYVPPQKK